MTSQSDTANHLGAGVARVDGVEHRGGDVCPYSPDLYPDVLEYFKELREKAPVHLRADGSFELSKYEDVMDALRDPETFSSNHEIAQTPLDDANYRSIVYSDDPIHLSLRQLVNR